MTSKPAIQSADRAAEQERLPVGVVVTASHAPSGASPSTGPSHRWQSQVKRFG